MYYVIIWESSKYAVTFVLVMKRLKTFDIKSKVNRKNRQQIFVNLNYSAIKQKKIQQIQKIKFVPEYIFYLFYYNHVTNMKIKRVKKLLRINETFIIINTKYH